MGKCISKNPAAITLAISEKDLANVSYILSKVSSESLPYIKPLTNDADEQQQQQQQHDLCEYIPVNDTTNGHVVATTKDYCQNGKQFSNNQNTYKQSLEAHKTTTDSSAAVIKSVIKQQKKRMIACVDKRNHNTTYDDGYNQMADVTDGDHNSNDAFALDIDVVESLLNVGKQQSSYNTNKNNNNNNNNNHNKVPLDFVAEMSFASTTNQQLYKNCDHHHHHHCHHYLTNNCYNNNNCNENSYNNIHRNYYYTDIQQCLVELHSYRQLRQLQQLQQYANCTNTNKLVSYSDRLRKLLKRQRRLQKLLKLVALASSSKAQDFSHHNDDDVNDDDDDFSKTSRISTDYNNKLQGQAESKKSLKKHLTGGEIRETKGTAMSFGFRKNLNTTPKKLKKLIRGDTKHVKKQDKCNNLCSDGHTCGVDGVGVGCISSETNKIEAKTVPNAQNNVDDNALKTIKRDDNGNADLLGNIHFEKVGAAAYTNTTTTTTTATEQNLNIANKGAFNEHHVSSAGQAVLPGAVSRFGYRGPMRPSSTDITHRWQRDTYDNIQNNNFQSSHNNANNTRGVLVSSLKRRSKSAHAGRVTSSSNESESETSSGSRTAAILKTTQPKSIKFNLKQNSTIEYDRRQFFDAPLSSSAVATRTVQNINYCGIHNNSVIRPTPRMATAPYSKFTLQTVSLPKPEYAVPISIQATTPSTPSNSYASSPVMMVSTGARAKEDKRGGLVIGRNQSYAVAHVQHPLTVAQTQQLDTKAAKHMVNSSTRGTFCGSREISADSGIASLDMNFDNSFSSGTRSTASRHASPKRSRSRPRNLQMVMNGRGKFEVRDLDESLSSESSSIVEPLALPKLPSESHTVPLPLSGLVRSNTVLSRESYELKNAEAEARQEDVGKNLNENRKLSNNSTRAPSEEDSASIDEEKLHLDRSTTEKSIKERRFRDINTGSSRTSSPGSSILLSWCNAGESLAVKDFSTLSLSSTEDSNKRDNRLTEEEQDSAERKNNLELNDDDDENSILNTDMQISTISSLANSVALPILDELDTSHELAQNDFSVRPLSICSATDESKFAEIALQGSTFLLDDETSPTDSLVSSTDSEEAACKQKKHKINEELQEKDIDEISPELDLASPISPGTPTHASHSLSLSDCGNLIDDEIADQPALLFNQESQEVGGGDSIASRRDKTDTPTLMDSFNSMRQSVHSQTRSRSALHQAMELSLRTPMSLRKAVMERAESLDTLSPCESICSDDLIMDFDMASSRDSIERSASIKSRSGSDLNKIDDQELFTELDRKGSDVMRELNTLLRSHAKKIENKDQSAHLPARATRLLNRSRMQQQSCSLTNEDSDHSNSINNVRTPLSVRRNYNNTTTTTSTASSTQNNSANSSLKRNQAHHLHHHLHHHLNNLQGTSQSRLHQRDLHSSSDDLMLYDKSFRNAMIQDVLQFKKQLIRLRRILQETETLNPFENDNCQLFASCGLDSKLLDDIDLASLTSSTTDDPMQELADLRRQVVYLQGQVDDRDRTIRLQKNLIDELEADKSKGPQQLLLKNETAKQFINMATQTERLRPYSIGMESLSRSKPEYISYTTLFPAICNDSNSSTTTTIIEQHPKPGDDRNGQQNGNQTRRHTIISTTLTNYNHQQKPPLHMPRRASIACEQSTAPSTYKPVKITLIGDPLKHWNSESMGLNSQHNCEELKKNLMNCSRDYKDIKQISKAIMTNGNCQQQKPLEQQQQKQQQQQTQQNLQNIFKAQQQQQQQYNHHKLYRTPHHQHNNLKPTVTIV